MKVSYVVSKPLFNVGVIQGVQGCGWGNTPEKILTTRFLNSSEKVKPCFF